MGRECKRQAASREQEEEKGRNQKIENRREVEETGLRVGCRVRYRAS
jgi:hypothetical protein